jgi:hypothetical protein
MHMYPAETGAAIQTEPPGKAVDERPDKRENPCRTSPQRYILSYVPRCTVFVSSHAAAEAHRRRTLLDENAVSHFMVGTSDASSAPLAMLWNPSPLMVSCAAVSPILLLGARASIGKRWLLGIHSSLHAGPVLTPLQPDLLSQTCTVGVARCSARNESIGHSECGVHACPTFKTKTSDRFCPIPEPELLSSQQPGLYCTLMFSCLVDRDALHTRVPSVCTSACCNADHPAQGGSELAGLAVSILPRFELEKQGLDNPPRRGAGTEGK